MQRIDQCFDDLRTQGRKALIPFITAGDPDAASTVQMMHRLVAAGADVIELGVPFSDPMADGPVIQKASERALAKGMSVAGVLDIVRHFRQDNNNIPIVLMGYLNPIEAMGYAAFAKAAQQAGVDGLLTVDLPPEEAAELSNQLVDHELAPIFLVAPTSSDERIKAIAEIARGYVYYVSLKGVTGSAALNVMEVEEKMVHIRQFVQLPIGVGFGIKSAEHAAAIARVADAVVVGSALVEKMAQLGNEHNAMYDAVSSVVQEMRSAMDAV